MSRFSHSMIIVFVYLAVLTLSSCATNELQFAQDAAYDPITQDLTVIDHQYPPTIHELLMPSHGQTLSGFLLLANGAGPHPTVVLLHGYPGNEKNLDLAQSMRRAGFNVLFFHYRGAWGSEGNYALSHLSEDVASVLSFARIHHQKYRIDVERLSLIGHSMGGFTALRAGARDKDVICVGGLAASNLGDYASRPAAALKGFSDYTDKLVMLEGFGGEKALAEIARHADSFDLRNDAVGLVGKSVLLITGDADTVVPPSVQHQLRQAYEPHSGIKLKTLIIPGDHSFSVSRIKLQREILSWLVQECR